MRWKIKVMEVNLLFDEDALCKYIKNNFLTTIIPLTFRYSNVIIHLNT